MLTLHYTCTQACRLIKVVAIELSILNIYNFLLINLRCLKGVESNATGGGSYDLILKELLARKNNACNFV